MKGIYSIALAAALATLAGCSQMENELLVENEVQQEGAVRIKAVLEGADDVDTKTVLGTPEGNLYPVLWSENDQIKILTSGHRVADGVGKKMTLEAGAGTSTGVFAGMVPVLPDGCKLYYAVYPYSLEASIGMPDEQGWDWDEGIARPEGEFNEITLANRVIIPLPSVQKYAEHSFGQDYSPALAVTDDVTSDNAELKFKNACGLLQINLTGDVKVVKIVLEDNLLQPLWGTLYMHYRMREEPFWEQFSLSLNHVDGLETDDVKKSVLTLECDEPVQLTDEPTDFYFAIPVLSLLATDGNEEGFSSPLSGGFTIRVYDQNGEEVYVKSTEADNHIVRSKIRQMPVVDIRSRHLTDLSANGTANSYIVRPNSTAKFYALTRGVGSYPVGNIARAEVYWETNMSKHESLTDRIDGLDYETRDVQHGDVLKSVSYDPATGYVTLKTGPYSGNALVTVKDSEGTILWSWHIWVTDYNPELFESQEAYDGAVFMNRNLGALGSVALGSNDLSDYGLRYSWGRKDPLEGTDFYLGTRFKYFPYDPFDDKSADSEMGYEDEYIARHPTTYVMNGFPMTKDRGTYKWDKKKNDNDPCPPGWQVTDFEVFHEMIGGYVSMDLTFTSDRSFDLWGEFHKERQNYWANTKIRSVAVSEDGFSTEATFPVTRHWTNRRSYSYGYDGISAYSGLLQCDVNELLPVRCQRTSTVKPSKEVIDLSKDGTANSYMVEPANSYKFKANVKGNSDESIGAVAGVDVIYMTQNSNSVRLGDDSRVLRDVYFDNGYIYFSTSLDHIYGNAVIAVKDILGNIVWSWHIWSVDYDPEVDYDMVDWGDGVRKVMKMNLGALSNKPKTSQSLGMMYQWGRKDPFISTNGYVGQTQCNIDGLTLQPEEYNESTGNVWYVLRHPNRFITGNEEGNWLAEPDNGLWAEEKTIFDPCPLGWKVPSRPQWEGDKLFIGEFDYGLTMGGIWYPASGYRNTSFNFTAVGAEGHYWYATAQDDNNAYAFYFDEETIDVANHADSKAQCHPVRCVKE